MRVSVAICTWNRADLLAQTLEAMTRLQVPVEIDWELLVVNNNCTDETDEVLARYGNQLPLRRCWEPKPGLSNARNRAVEEASGEYLVWTDDDVLVNDDWLAAYHRAFHSWPDAAVFGGPVAPWFAGSAPDWLARAFPRVAAAYAAIDLGFVPRPLDRENLPFGANMAIRMREQRRHPFDPRLGVCQANRGAGEETRVMQAILQEGGFGRWVPEAQVRHYIPLERQTVRYLRSYFFAYGRGRAEESGPDNSKKWFGRPRWLLRRALEQELRFRIQHGCGRVEEWVEALVQASTAWGMLANREVARRRLPEAPLALS